MRTAFLSSLLLSATCAFSQISGPDTVKVNIPATFHVAAGATSYAWSTGTISSQPVNSTNNPLSSTMFSTVADAIMKVENGNYYGFVLNKSGDLVKLAFGTSPNNTPMATNMGNFGVTLANGQGIDIIYDNDSWYGFITNGRYLVRLDFGPSLNSTPVAALMDFNSVMWYPMQITVLRTSPTQVVAFAGHFGLNSILRFDFGAAITNTPTVALIGNSSNFSSACNFALHQQAGNWHMIVSSLTGHTLSRVDFGSTITNNTPVITNLGNFNNQLAYPRGVSLLPDCGGLYGTIINENGTIGKLDFNGSITNQPTVTPFLTFPNLSGLSNGYPYWHNDSLFMFMSNFNNFDLGRIDLQALPANAINQSGYNLTSFTHTFTVPGTYDISVQLDQGSASGATTYCKTVVVENTINSIRELAQNAIELYPNPSDGRITIGLENVSGKQVALNCISTTGAVVYTRSLPVENNRVKASVDLSGLPRGAYSIRLESGEKTYSRTLILQ